MLLTEYDEKKHMNSIREEGREEGEERLNTLFTLLLEQNRIDDLKKANKSKEYRQKLFDEFGL